MGGIALHFTNSQCQLKFYFIFTIIIYIYTLHCLEFILKHCEDDQSYKMCQQFVLNVSVRSFLLTKFKKLNLKHFLNEFSIV